MQAYKPFADPVPSKTKQYQLILTKCQPVSSYTDPVPSSTTFNSSSCEAQFSQLNNFSFYNLFDESHRVYLVSFEFHFIFFFFFGDDWELVMLVKMYLGAYFRYCDFTGCEMILLQKLLIIFLDNLPCAGVRDPIREGILPEFLCLHLFFRQVDLA